MRLRKMKFEVEVEFEVWCGSLNIFEIEEWWKPEDEIWSWSLNLKFEAEVWTYLKLKKFKADEIWSWCLNLKFEAEVWTYLKLKKTNG